jgi:hypothetical protein
MTNYDGVFWLNLTNIVLGIVVLLAVLVAGYGVAWELVSRRKKAHSLDSLKMEMKAMWQNEHAHGLRVPELGMTMADGGEPTKSLPEKPPVKKRS